MTIQMTSRQMNGLALVDLRGSLAAGAAAERGGLAAAVAQLADAGFVNIAVNLAEVTRVDARGLGELVLALRAAHDRSAHLALVAPPPRLRRLLSLTRLDTVFELCDSEADAQDDDDRLRMSCATLASSTRILSSSA
jgi:anti-sigma B factor antagonist